MLFKSQSKIKSQSVTQNLESYSSTELLEDKLSLEIYDLLQNQEKDAITIAIELDRGVSEVRSILKKLNGYLVELDDFSDLWRLKRPQSEELIIDPEFRSLIPPLTTDERAQLRANIIAEGCRDPLVVWQEENILLDGHNRHAICNELAASFEIIYLNFGDRAHAIDWIINNQLGRRNLPPEQKKYLQGKRYNDMKLTHGGDRGNQYTKELSGKSELLAKAQSEPLPKANTAEKLAKEFNCGKDTIKRAGKFATDIDTISDWAGEDLKVNILNGTVKLTNSQVADLAAIAEEEPEKVREVIESIKRGENSVVAIAKIKPQLTYQVGNKVLINNQILGVIVGCSEFEVEIRTWKDTILQKVLKSEIKPVDRDYITVCANLPVGSLAWLQENFENFEEAIEELLKNQGAS